MKKSPGLGRPGVDGPFIKNVNVSKSNQGTVYIVAGSAATLYAAPMPHAALPVGMGELGTGVIDISGNQLSFSFVNDQGVVQDSFTIIKPYAAADADSDGLPDDYENEYGLNPADGADAAADADGDGSSSRDEFLAGTDPRDASSKLLTQLQTGVHGYIVRFNTVPGYLYTVQRRDDIQTGLWTSIASDLPGTGAERSVTDTEANLSGKRFYRVRVQPE
jgi:hypothetical protein